jgi:hypothetical protein
MTLVLFMSMLLNGCDLLDGVDMDRDSELNVHAEYASSHPWIGKWAKFESPMAYLTNLPPGFDHAVTMRIG